MLRSIIPLDILFEGENKIPWEIMFAMNSRANAFFRFTKYIMIIKCSEKNIYTFI